MFFVYFIKINDTIKIGSCKQQSKHLKQRLSEAKRWNPSSKIIGVISCDTKDLERRIHLYFAEYNIRNEVFKADKRIIRFVKNFCDWAIGKRAVSYSQNQFYSYFAKLGEIKPNQYTLKEFRKKLKSEGITMQSKPISLTQWLIPFDVYALKIKAVEELKKTKKIIVRREYDYDLDSYVEIIEDANDGYKEIEVSETTDYDAIEAIYKKVQPSKYSKKIDNLTKRLTKKLHLNTNHKFDSFLPHNVMIDNRKRLHQEDKCPHSAYASDLYFTEQYGEEESSWETYFDDEWEIYI